MLRARGSPLRLVLLALCLAACSDYTLTGEERPPEPWVPDDVEDDATPVDDPLEGDPVCRDRRYPGYPTSSDAVCEDRIETGTFTPVVEWAIDLFTTAPAYNNVMMQPIVVSLTDDDGDGDIDADDVPDILVARYPSTSWTGAGVLTAISGDGSRVHWDNETIGVQGSAGLAAGDIDGDGIVEIIAPTADGRAVALEHDGTVKWTSPALMLSGCYATAPAISDMDGDGKPEIVLGNVILRNDGTIRGRGASGNGMCASFPVDLDGDGIQEVVAGNAIYDPDGNTLASTALVDGYPAVADFDGDGVPEIVVVDSRQGVRLHDAAFGDVWGRPTIGMGPPTIADFDGDGEPEIGVAGSSSYTVLDGDGTPLWRNTTTDGSSGRTGSAVFDFEGDGAAEVVYADETRLWVFSGLDGSVKLEDANHTSWTWIEYPVIVDVDGDGEAEIVVPNGQYASTTSGARYGLTVVGDADRSWMPARKIWNQHAYHITNVADDGTIPTSAEPPWLHANTFRSGDMSGRGGTAAPDLTVAKGELCEIECDRGRLVAWVHPGNQGAVDAAGATLRVSALVGAERTLLTERSLGALAAGTYGNGVRVDITGVDPTTIDTLVVEIAGDPECDTANDVLLWSGPFCR